MKLILTPLLLMLSVFLCSCSYPVKPVSIPAVNIYSSYDEKIPGNWAIVTSTNVKNIKREIIASSYTCSAHKYPIEVGDTVDNSIKETMRLVFEDTADYDDMPTGKELDRISADGTVLIELNTFEPRVRCSMGLLSGTCEGETDVGFGVIVRDRSQKLLAASAGNSAKIDGEMGSACGGAIAVLSESISMGVKKALERLGERLSNSSRLRRNSTVAEN